jgi:hypothetical protein
MTWIAVEITFQIHSVMIDVQDSALIIIAIMKIYTDLRPLHAI